MSAYHKKIQGERIELVPVDLNVALEVFTELTATVLTYMQKTPPSSLNDCIKDIEKYMNDRVNETAFIYSVRTISEREFLGLCGIAKLKSTLPEIGIWLKESSWGKGYGTEAVTSLIVFAKENLSINRFLYPVDKRNVSSVKIADKLNGVARNNKTFTCDCGKILQIVEYEIIV